LELDDLARVSFRLRSGTIRIVLTERSGRRAGVSKKESRNAQTITFRKGEPIIFFEVTPGDASEFSNTPDSRRECRRFQMRLELSHCVPNAIGVPPVPAHEMENCRMFISVGRREPLSYVKVHRFRRAYGASYT
jgi:hypothetical protein